ncbi:MAG: hypothetical protein DRN20_03080 [Thermoplasmata archaeon]|nr:MAG: hypothetical protein DRN20_03080 [Thermoplasmata archaeon]
MLFQFLNIGGALTYIAQKGESALLLVDAPRNYTLSPSNPPLAHATIKSFFASWTIILFFLSKRYLKRVLIIMLGD